jgi:ABC-type Zn2+ transport system substrate-binding protein/surface adhesin
MTEVNSSAEIATVEDRRKFLATCGKFAVVTPPAITMLLSTSLNSTAIANSGGRGDSGEHRGHDNDHDRDHDRNEDRHHGKDHDD